MCTSGARAFRPRAQQVEPGSWTGVRARKMGDLVRKGKAEPAGHIRPVSHQKNLGSFSSHGSHRIEAGDLVGGCCHDQVREVVVQTLGGRIEVVRRWEIQSVTGRERIIKDKAKSFGLPA